jgi:hypothetical protein
MLPTSASPLIVGIRRKYLSNGCSPAASRSREKDSRRCRSGGQRDHEDICREPEATASHAATGSAKIALFLSYQLVYILIASTVPGACFCAD